MNRPEVVPNLKMWAPEAVDRQGGADVALDALLDTFREGVEAHPRSAQTEIGPSEVGHPCDRWLAHRLAGTPSTGKQPLGWRQAVGTAVHTQATVWAHDWNAFHNTIWLADLYVDVGELYPGRPVRGHLDFLHLPTATVIDLKVPGPTAMKKFRTGGVESPQYDVQRQLYGRGCQRSGFTPEHVAILRTPSAGELHESTRTHEPYSETKAVDALTRAGGIARLVDALGSNAAPLLGTTEHYCTRCEWFAPGATDLTRACPGAGNRAASTPPAALTSLIAPVKENAA